MENHIIFTNTKIAHTQKRDLNHDINYIPLDNPLCHLYLFSMHINPDILYILLLCYLLGSIPFGLIISKIAGIGDLRNVGSGNIGATNMMRAGGKKLAALTLILDLAKGAAATWLACRVLSGNMGAAGLFIATMGHIFPIWLKFKGGKGVATFLGSLLVLDPMLGAAFICIWIAVFTLTRISAKAALVATCVMPLATYILMGLQPALYVGCIAIIIIYRHKDNIMRMLGGKEKSFK